MADHSTSWQRLSQVVSEIDAQLAKILQAAHGIGLSEFHALRHLAEAPDRELRMQDLAVKLRLNQSSVTRLSERLERAGLTVRDLCADDKRGIYAVLTDKGQASLELASQSYREALERAIKEFGCDDLLAAKSMKVKKKKSA